MGELIAAAATIALALMLGAVAFVAEALSQVRSPRSRDAVEPTEEPSSTAGSEP